MFVIPRGLVRDPVSLLHLPAEGKEVLDSTYWIRRLRCGDVALASTPVVVLPVNQIPDFTDQHGEN